MSRLIRWLEQFRDKCNLFISVVDRQLCLEVKQCRYIPILCRTKEAVDRNRLRWLTRFVHVQRTPIQHNVLLRGKRSLRYIARRIAQCSFSMAAPNYEQCRVTTPREPNTQERRQKTRPLAQLKNRTNDDYAASSAGYRQN